MLTLNSTTVDSTDNTWQIDILKFLMLHSCFTVSTPNEDLDHVSSNWVVYGVYYRYIINILSLTDFYFYLIPTWETYISSFFFTEESSAMVATLQGYF